MALLSVNVNKFALLRNARGADIPNLVDMCEKCINFGAQGITVHPRPDERHAKFSDLPDIAKLVQKFNQIEFNIEGYPSNFFIKEVLKNHPHQVTLVPDPPNALTSSFGWNCKENKSLLKETVNEFKSHNIRVSLFINPSIENLENLSEIKTDRVELYTFDYAKNYLSNYQTSIAPYVEVANFINKNFPNIGLNAGHDLNLQNLSLILEKIPTIREVSIGHALICDTFIFGLKETIKKYKCITGKN
ncbi:pyridoxine 5'-phosphate synthase [Alphaproteobacteria bacterium]|nr:pyridoxine 5'-phosphate synthase [Alphaproteobacteria bacterium]